MNRYLRMLLQVGLLAMTAVLASRLEAMPQTNKTITLDYDGWSWTTITTANDVAELLIGYFDTYDQLKIEPAPETKLTEAMTVTIRDTANQSLNPTVAKNYQNIKIATATPTKPAAPAVKPAQIKSGLATWYRFGDKLTAASRAYPKGTKLRVIALNSGKSVDVVVNDYGPSALTGIDLDLNVPAFEALAPLGAGKIKVKYYKI